MTVASPPPTVRLGAVVLAAGLSRRAGCANKLLFDVDGHPMIRRVTERTLASRADPVVVVTGHESRAVQAALEPLLEGPGPCKLHCVHNMDYASGMSSSIRVGIRSLRRAKVDAALLVLGDMPWVEPETMNAIIDAFAHRPEVDAVVPEHDGRRGNPVAWSARCFDRLEALRGDVGARRLLQDPATKVVAIAAPTDAIHRDRDLT